MFGTGSQKCVPMSMAVGRGNTEQWYSKTEEGTGLGWRRRRLLKVAGLTKGPDAQHWGYSCYHVSSPALLKADPPVTKSTFNFRFKSFRSIV